MACKIPQIQQTNLPEAEKLRLENIHTSIFEEARDSGLFRRIDNRFQTIKSEYAKATEFVAKINNKYNTPVSRLNSIGNGNSVLGVNVLPLAQQQGELFLQKPETQPNIAPKEIVDLSKDLLSKMGVDYQKVKDIYVNGEKIGANGVANIMQGLVQIIEGKESETLPEEAIHFAVEILEQKNPALFRQLLSEINNYPIYKEVLATYSSDPRYRTVDGKPNILKLKKEAIAKQLVNVIINKFEGNEEDYLRIAKTQNWWSKILEFLRNLFIQSGFDKAAMDILAGNAPGTVEDIKGIVEENSYLQLTLQQEIQSRIIASQQNIQKVKEEAKKEPLLMDSDEADNYYRVRDEATGEWKRVTKRVTDRVKEYYRKKFPNQNFSEAEKKFNELKKESGIKGHNDLEEIHNRYYHADGTKRDTPLKREEKPNLNEDLYNKLEKYYADYVSQLPEGTLVFAEIKLYDEKIDEAGTIDFLAVTPEGKATILDWKFMTVGSESEDIAWYKKGAYNIQLGRYKEILREVYGVKEFGQIRVIPILMDFKHSNPNNRSSPLVLSGVNIGSIDTNKIEKLTLLPFAEISESTGIESLDKVLKILNNYYQKVASERPVEEEDKLFKKERLRIINQAIRLAQINKNILPIIDTIEVIKREGERLMNDYKVIYKDQPLDQFVGKDKELSDFSLELKEYEDLAKIFTEIGDDIGNLIYTPDMEKSAKTDEEKEAVKKLKGYLDKLNEDSRLIRITRKDIIQISKDFADKFIGLRNQVVGLSGPEAVVKGIASNFRNSSELPMKSLNILSQLAEQAMSKAASKALESVQKIDNLRQKLEKQGDLKEIVKKLHQKDDKGNILIKLITKYDKQFYETLKDNAVKGGSLKWIKENIDIESYKKEADKRIKKQIEYINSQDYPGNESDQTTRRDIEIDKVKRLYDIDYFGFNGWTNTLLFKYPLDKWLSKEYKEISKNPDLLELYNFIVEYNEEAKNIGYLQNNYYSTFLPFLRKGMAEQLSWDQSISPVRNFQKAFELNPEDIGYGERDVITGELINTIPKYFTYDFTRKGNGEYDTSEASLELFKNLISYVQQVEKYRYLDEIEGQMILLKSIEEFKGHLKTDKLGKIVRDSDGKVKVEEGNEANSKLFDDFLRTTIYGQKYVLSDTDTALNFGKVINFFKNTVNKTAGREILKVNEDVKPSSLVKIMDGLNKGFSLKTLGLDIIPGAVNAFGTNMQMAAQAGNYFKYAEFAKNQGILTFQRFKGEEEKELFVELLNTFSPMKDDPSYEIYKKAGITKITKGNLGDTIMFFMRQPELLAEKAVFLTLLQNMMVVDGKIVSIPEYVKTKNKDRFTVEGKRKLNSEIESLKREKSLYTLAKLKDGKLEIEGLDLNNKDELNRLTLLSRNISNKATASQSRTSTNKMSMNVWTNSMMVFKKWIPPLADTRFSEFRKVGDNFSVKINEDGIPEGTKYDIGRLRLLGYIFSQDLGNALKNIKNIAFLNEKGIEEIDKMLEDFRKSYEERNNEPLYITREEFIELINRNTVNQLRELATLAIMVLAAFSLGLIAPEDDEDRAAKNLHRYTQKVIHRFIGELSFFYNPAEFGSVLTGGIFPAISLIEDFARFMRHFWLETTGLDLDPDTSFEDVRKKAQPIKHLMKMFPGTKSAVTYFSILSEEFAREYDVTIQKDSFK